MATDKNKPSVSIVVPCRNEREHIETVLETILAQQPPPGNFEVIVSDGMSDDGTREIILRLARADARVRMVDNRCGIVATGLNAAIREARGSVIIRMDAHTTYAPDYVYQCVQVLRETAADNVGGPWIARGRGRVGKAIAAAFQSSFASGGARGHDPHYSGPVDTVYLGCWHREIFERIGFFDEELVRNQDDEFNLRLVRSGGKIWQSVRIKSWYTPRTSLAALFNQHVQYGYWKVRVIQKHKIPASLRHLVPGCFVSLLAALPLVSRLWPPALWIWLGLVGMYIGCNFMASLLTALSKDYKLFPLLVVVFACFHIAYGYGFLRGICDFVILRRKARSKYNVLTRKPTDRLPQQKMVR